MPSRENWSDCLHSEWCVLGAGHRRTAARVEDRILYRESQLLATENVPKFTDDRCCRE